MDWQRPIARILNWAEEKFDRLQYGAGSHRNLKGKLAIIPYSGFGYARFIYLRGRILKDKGISSLREDGTLWDNLIDMYRRFQSDEIPGARLQAIFQESEMVTQTDEEGFFEVCLELAEPLLPDPAWQPVDLELLSPRLPEDSAVRAEAWILSVSPQAQFGVISDIDDTILVSHATNPLRMGLIMLLNNARTRKAFPGVATFYQALQKGTLEATSNPLFYVSSSPWNLYDLLVDFIQVQGIPLGPMISLRDWGITNQEFLPTRHRQHKLSAIRLILDLLPQLPFLLIGDNGQEDPQIYQEIVQDYPGRILGVYIRHVSGGRNREKAIRQVGEQIEATGSAFLLTPETQEMTRHATNQGWICGN